MGLVTKDDAWCLTDEVWEQIEPLLLVRKLHPLGCHNPRVADRDAMNAILFLLRTGCQWDALDATGICSCSPALPAFPGMDGNGRARGVLATGADRIRRHQGDRLVMVVDGWCDGEGSAFGFKKTGANPADRGKQGVKRSLLTEASGVPLRRAVGWWSALIAG